MNKPFSLFLGTLFFTFLISCSEDESPLTCEDIGPSLMATDIADATCAGGGEVTLVAEGGEAPYEYSLDGISFRNVSTFTGIPAGNYIGMVRDANDCDASSSTITIEAAVGSITATIFQDEYAGCGSTSGQITIEATGGTGTLMYSIDGATASTDNVFSSLSTGSHDILIEDEESCINEQTVHVLSGISYGSTIQGQSESISTILTANCDGSDCHVGGTAGLPDWSSLSTVQANAQAIKRVTQDKSMPFIGSLTDEQIALIACWVDDGAQDN
ncbi:MAG: hypothetical protein JXR07_13410 [Reichenbachiella sp.]